MTTISERKKKKIIISQSTILCPHVQTKHSHNSYVLDDWNKSLSMAGIKVISVLLSYTKFPFFNIRKLFCGDLISSAMANFILDGDLKENESNLFFTWKSKEPRTYPENRSNGQNPLISRIFTFSFCKIYIRN